MSGYSSLSRWHGTTFQQIWAGEGSWRHWVGATLPSNRPLKWSVLVAVDTGAVVSTWTRSGGFRFSDGRGGWWEETRPTVKAAGEPTP